MRPLSVLLLLILFLPVAELGAHNYLPAPEQDEVTVIENIEVSRAAYRSLETAEDYDVYRFSAKAGTEIYISLTIPRLPHLRRFAPAVALVSADHPLPASAVLSRTRTTLLSAYLLRHRAVAKLPEAHHTLVFGFAGSRGEFYEPFTGTRYWELQEVTVQAPATGTYRLVVFSPQGATGKYVLAPGRAERFSFGDILALPRVRIKVRRFMEEPVWGDYLFWSLLGAAAAGGLTYGIVNWVGK